MSKRILCLGTNSELTDSMATDIAKDHGLENQGLICDTRSLQIRDGVFHTSLADLSVGDILAISSEFDLIIMLDQPREVWSHWKLLQTTYKTCRDLENRGRAVVFRDNQNIKRLQKIQQMTDTNPSWCIYPWINLVTRDEKGLELCARSDTNLSTEFTVGSWQHSAKRLEIQRRMLAGEKLPGHCDVCYRYEDKNIESYRQYESNDWCNQLDIASFDELDKIQAPKYYEVHWSNKCNLRCRGCVPSRSSAIDEEFRKHHVIMPHPDQVPAKYPAIDIVDIDSLDETSRVYITGGEPVIMPETLEFMQKCVDAKKLDFELTMSTNGVKFPSAFLRLAQNFSKINFSFSLDGYGSVNDYWRSGSTWQKIVDNMHMIRSLGHEISINTVPGIYNVTNLHLLMEWLDRAFPTTAIYMQINHVGFQSAYNHPDGDAVINSMKRCQQTKVYWSDGKSCRSSIDSILDHYTAHKGIFDRSDLKTFFDFNDQLDKIRGVKLGDHIPELEACRRLI